MLPVRPFMKPTLKKVNNSNMSKIRQDLVWEKIGYDWANKKMLVKVYDHLKFIVEDTYTIKSWINVVRRMLIEDGRINEVNVNGYYSTIRNILKDIKVIQFKDKQLQKGPNWDRFYSDEDWSWFKTNTNCGGYGEIVK